MKIAQNGAWQNEGQEGHAFDIKLAREIYKFCYYHHIQEITDLGCGICSYVNYLKRQYDIFDVRGFDGNPNTVDYGGYYLDLSKKLNPLLILKTDMVISLEVGEHIPVEFEQNFIDNVCNFSSKFVIMSWAIEGQGGDGHVNCKNNNYIISEMKKRNFIPYMETTKLFRKRAKLPWFKNTIIVYRKLIK